MQFFCCKLRNSADVQSGSRESWFTLTGIKCVFLQSYYQRKSIEEGKKAMQKHVVIFPGRGGGGGGFYYIAIFSGGNWGFYYIAIFPVGASSMEKS